jgi:DNA-binding MarR family transcriptional regulator
MADPAANTEAAVADLLQATGQLLRRVRAESNPGELTWSQASALSRLHKQGPMTIADLARADSVKPQSMGATVAGLEREGLVERQPHPADGRQVLFGLTEAGIANRRTNSVLKRAWLSAAMAQLDPGEIQTIITAAALIKRLAK